MSNPPFPIPACTLDSITNCPTTSPFKVTQVDETGCAPYEKDSDSDGVSDEDDWAPFDANQSYDSDEDGIGDNNQVEGGDDCPQQAGNSSIDRVGCIDTDGDGISNPSSGWKVSDGADWKSQDPTQWADSDGDGYGDNWGNETWNLSRDLSWPGEFIVGATKAAYFKDIRKIVPHHFLLVPGVGAQGGNLQDVCKYGLNEDIGLLINSSRGIIYASPSEDFAKVAAEKALELQKEMAVVLSKKS